jgi:uncharacterized protein (DUF1330 family)
MKTSLAVGVATLVGMSFGGIAVHTLHAQTKAPVYYVGEIDVTDEAGYQRDFVPQATKTIQSGGGRFLARGGKTTTLLGEPVKNRVVIQQWDSMDQVRKWFDSEEQKKLREIQAKYSKVRAYVVEGVPAK